MTTARRAVTAARGDLPARYFNLCEGCKRAVLSEGLGAGEAAAATSFEAAEHR